MTAEKIQIAFSGFGEEMAQNAATPQMERAPRQTAPAAALATQEPSAIWLASLMAKGCQIPGGGQELAVSWKHASGKPLYTNWGMIASWITGDTAVPLESEE